MSSTTVPSIARGLVSQWTLLVSLSRCTRLNPTYGFTLHFPLIMRPVFRLRPILHIFASKWQSRVPGGDIASRWHWKASAVWSHLSHTCWWAPTYAYPLFRPVLLPQLYHRVVNWMFVFPFQHISWIVHTFFLTTTWGFLSPIMQIADQACCP